MQRSEVMNQIKEFIATQVLDGQAIGLDENTPLLEWGVINSMEIIRLLSFIQQTFGYDLPADKVVADNFVNLNAITNLVMETALQENVIEK